MNLASTSVRRSITFIMIFIGLLGAGLFGLSQLGVDLYPDIQFPMVFIVTQLEGAGPEEMEQLVTEPIEQAVSRVKNLKKVTSSSSSGMSFVMAEFDWGIDLHKAETDLRRMLEMYEDFLPEDATDPFILALDPSAQPVMFVTFTSDILNSYDLRELLEEEIEPRLIRLDGVGSVMIQGGPVRQIKVEVDPARLLQSGVTVTQIVGALSSVRDDQPAGRVETGGMTINVRVESAFHSVEEIEQLVVGRSNNGNILLRDVADIIDGEREYLNYVRLNGENTVVLFAMRRADANTVNVCETLQQEIDRITENYSDRLSSSIIWNQAEYINDSISNLSGTGVQAFFIAILVLLFFLRSLRSSITVGISIPMSIIVTFAAMYAFDLDINIISLAGLALAVGMLVDNSIVVLESIFRRREKGEKPREAAVNGAKEVAMAITASTLTTLAVFVPVLFVPGIAGQLFRDMSLTISFSLLVSLFVALSLVPLLTSKMKKMFREHRSGSIADRTGKLITALEKRYNKMVEWTVNHRKLVILSTIGFFIFSMFMIKFVDTEFMPEDDEGFITIDYERSVGTNLTETDRTARKIEDAIKSMIPEEDIFAIYTEVGEGEGIGAIFGTSSPSEGSIFVRLVKVTERETGAEEYTEMIREYLKTIPDIDYTIGSGGGPFDATAAIEIQVYGYDFDELRSFGQYLKEELEKIEGTREVTSSLEEQIPEYTFVPDPAVLSIYGISPATVARELTYCLQGTAASYFRESGEEHEIFVRYPEEYRDSREDIEYTPVLGIPLISLGSLRDRLAPNTITRINQGRVVTVSCSVAGRALGDVAADVNTMLDTIDTRGLRIELGGQVKDQAETFLYLGIAILVAAALVYMVMASQFESLLEPFIIILTVPMAFIGVVWILMVTGTTLSVVALIGVLMLAGIVVNNGIVMIDYANQLRRAGKDIIPAIIEASTIRMRPILMTAMTTAFAMVPLAMGMGEGAESWAPMALTVIGGLIAATFLTLLVEPCFYVVLGHRKKFRKNGNNNQSEKRETIQ